MEKKDKFLPIGTVVLLKGGKKELMITGYCIFPNGEMYEDGKKTDGSGRMFEYGACVYPEGIISSEVIYGFDHSQIDKVCHLGYETDTSKELSEVLNGGLKIYKEKMQEKESEA